MNNDIERIKELATKSKEEKWLKVEYNENKNKGDMQIELKSSCEFCFNAKWDCSNCLCPDILCSENGFGGLIGYLYNKYSDDMSLPIFYRDARDDYNLTLGVLDDLIDNGELSEEMVNSLKNTINNS